MRRSPRAAILAAFFALALSGCQPRAADAPAGKPVVIGLSLDTVREERWQRDRDMFVAHAESTGSS